MIHSKKIDILLNLYPEEEPLRFRTNLRNLKTIRGTRFESFLSFARMYETLKVLPLDTGSVEYLLFLEC